MFCQSGCVSSTLVSRISYYIFFFIWSLSERILTGGLKLLRKLGNHNRYFIKVQCHKQRIGIERNYRNATKKKYSTQAELVLVKKLTG